MTDLTFNGLGDDGLLLDDGTPTAVVIAGLVLPLSYESFVDTFYPQADEKTP